MTPGLGARSPADLDQSVLQGAAGPAAFTSSAFSHRARVMCGPLLALPGQRLGRPRRPTHQPRGEHIDLVQLKPTGKGTLSLGGPHPAKCAGRPESSRLDLTAEDRGADDVFSRVLWEGLKGRQPYPSSRRAAVAEVRSTY